MLEGIIHIKPVVKDFGLLCFMPKYTPGRYVPQNLEGLSRPVLSVTCNKRIPDNKMCYSIKYKQKQNENIVLD